MSLAATQLSEALFMGQVTDYATLRGWQWMHIQPGLTDRGRYRTPVSGPLGSGWPDLIMFRWQRVVAAELKSEKGRTTLNQQNVLATMTRSSKIETYVWRPSQWADIQEILR